MHAPNSSGKLTGTPFLFDATIRPARCLESALALYGNSSNWMDQAGCRPSSALSKRYHTSTPGKWVGVRTTQCRPSAQQTFKKGPADAAAAAAAVASESPERARITPLGTVLTRLGSRSALDHHFSCQSACIPCKGSHPCYPLTPSSLVTLVAAVHPRSHTKIRGCLSVCRSFGRCYCDLAFVVVTRVAPVDVGPVSVAVATVSDAAVVIAVYL